MSIQRKILSRNLPSLITVFAILAIVIFGCEKLNPQRKLIVKTRSIGIITYQSCKVTGEIVDICEGGISEHGFCFATNSNPSIGDDTVQLGSLSKAQSFSANLLELDPNTEYFVRAFARSNGATEYGEEMIFITSTKPITLPTVSTSAVSNITKTSADAGGNVTNTGGADVTARGVCWSINPNPTIADTATIDGSGPGDFISSMIKLNCGAKYYLRAYASNSLGTAYGEEISFSTSTCSTGNPPVASFSYSPTSVLEGEIVQFSDQSINIPTSWSWDFGDGSTSSAANPSHVYSVIGEHTITLTVANSDGSDSAEKTISVLPISGTTVTDYDGNVYNTIQIGEQIWMAENLRAVHYADGSSIPLVESSTEWAALSPDSKAYCWFDNDISNGNPFGGLYTWAAAMNGVNSSNSNPSDVQGICPDAWHLPSDVEWKELEIFLGMSASEADSLWSRGTNEGGKLKETGTLHWYSPNVGATNESGFSAISSGYRGEDNPFYYKQLVTYFWTATEDTESGAFDRSLYYGHSFVERRIAWKHCGFSVRCVKD